MSRKRVHGLGQSGDAQRDTAKLLQWIAGDRSATPWVNVKCHGHDSGTQLRFQEAEGRWGVTFRDGRGAGVEFANGQAEAVDVQCRECGMKTRRTVGGILPAVLESLVAWQREGRRHRPSVTWN